MSDQQREGARLFAMQAFEQQLTPAVLDALINNESKRRWLQQMLESDCLKIVRLEARWLPSDAPKVIK